jgi:hypothetical protein
VSEANDLLNRYKELLGNISEAVGSAPKQRVRAVTAFGPYLCQALEDGGLFLVKEGEGVVNGKVVKIRVPPKRAS